MRREHIADGWWTMPGDPVPSLAWPGTKNGATHRVWLPVAAQALLADMPMKPGLVFAGRVALPSPSLMRPCATSARRSRVERATPHDLRRTHGTTITALGFGREAMNRVQNHKEGGIADVYDRHEYADENRRVMEAVAARIMALVGGGPVASNVIELQAART